MKYLLKTKCVSPLVCVHMCTCVRACVCTRVGRAFMGIHRSTHSALRFSGCLPQCSAPGRLPSSGVLSCSVSQHCGAPTPTVNCVTCEQTNVMHRGASQASTGNSTMRTYILTLAPETTQNAHRHTQTHTCLPRRGKGQLALRFQPTPFHIPESLPKFKPGQEESPRIQGCSAF